MCVVDVAGEEHVANNRTSQPARLIEHVVIYTFDAADEHELSLAVDERVWVRTSRHISIYIFTILYIIYIYIYLFSLPFLFHTFLFVSLSHSFTLCLSLYKW